jgi:hypothetical protein
MHSCDRRCSYPAGMHFSMSPPGPKTSAMLGEGTGDAEALAEGVMHSASFAAR